MLDETLEAFRAEHPDGTLTTPDRPAITVRTYPDIRLAIEELLANAVAHNPAPESDCRIDVDLARHATDGGERAELRIRDNGPGIPEREAMVTGPGPGGYARSSSPATATPTTRSAT